MALFGGGHDVADLIARGKYARAIQLLREQLERGVADPRVRLQLADALALAGRPLEAVPVLEDLADEYARDGQGAKAIAVLKKTQRLDPGRRDISKKIAGLIKEPRRAGVGWQPREGADKSGYEPSGVTFAEDDFKQAAVVTDEARIAAARNASWVPSTREEAADDAGKITDMAGNTLDIPVPPAPAAPPPPAAVDAPIEVEVSVMEEESISPAAFQAAMLDVIQSALKKPASAPAEPAPVRAPKESPLFSGFSEDELVAVIQGLTLLTYEPGDIVLTQGDPGDSLFVLTEGVVKTFVRDGMRQVLVRTMEEGDFFGEISILSGKPRTATVTAATHCELLKLDRATLDGILATYPNVQNVLEDFYIQRASTQDELIRQRQSQRQ